MLQFSDYFESLEWRWHSDFVRFVETGDAGPEFKAFLKRDKSCQQLVAEAMTARVSQFEREIAEFAAPVVAPGTAGRPPVPVGAANTEGTRELAFSDPRHALEREKEHA